MKKIVKGYGKIQISVTSYGGVLPVEGAKVRIIYDSVGIRKGGEITSFTDEFGNSEDFLIPIYYKILEGKDKIFPGNNKCRVEITAEDYVTVKAHNIPVFPDLTVKTSFNMLPYKINGVF